MIKKSWKLWFKKVLPLQVYYYFRSLFFFKETIQLREIERNLFRLKEKKIKSQKINNFQNRKLLKLLNYANKHCPYYINLFSIYSISTTNLKDFARIPTLDKKLIKENFKTLSSDKLYSLPYNQSNTGGSTGEPLEFLTTNLVGAVDGVHQRFQFKLMGYKKGDLICGFGGMSVPEELYKKNIFWINTKSDYADWEYSSLYLNENTLHYYVCHFLESKPSFLRGYPSVIEAFGSYINQNNIHITFPIKGVELTSENYTFAQVESIKKIFKSNIYFQYGHSEACVFAYTTDNTYRYACSPFYGFTEVLDDFGNHVQKGEIGEIVVTSFYNFAQPFIRYRTGDRALYGGEEGGVVYLDSIEGRTQDYVLNYKKQKIFLTAITFGQHYESFRVIKKWQIIQREYGKVLFYIIPDVGFSQENEREISNKFKNIAGIDAEFVYVNNISPNKNGKFSFLIQHLSD